MTAPAAEPLRLAGSDVVAPVLQRVLDARPADQAIALTLDLTGSRPGRAALAAGAADAAVLALPPGENTPAGDFRIMPWAYVVPVAVVGDRNSLRQLALPQLAAVLGEGEAVNIRRWSELGLGGENAGRSIALLSWAPEGSVALEFVRHHVLRNPLFKSALTPAPTLAVMLDRLREDEAALGLLGVPPAGAAGVHVLSLARTAEDVAFGPTPENVHAGDYPLRLPLLLAVRADRAARHLDALRFLLGDEVAGALTEAGLMSVPAAARRQLALELESR